MGGLNLTLDEEELLLLSLFILLELMLVSLLFVPSIVFFSRKGGDIFLGKKAAQISHILCDV